MIEINNCENVFISNIIMEGNAEKNIELPPSKAGAIFVQKSSYVVIEAVKISSFNGKLYIIKYFFFNFNFFFFFF